MTLVRYLLPFLALACLSDAKFAPTRTTMLSPTTGKKVASAIPRGGAGSLDAEVTAKVATVVTMAQGLLFNVAPDMFNEQYGIKGMASEEATQFMTGQVGCGILSYGIVLYALLFQKTSLSVAILASYVFSLYHNLRMVLNGHWNEACGRGSSGGGWFVVAIFTGAIYAMTQDYADTANKVLSVFWSLCGLQMVLAPKSAWTLWKGNENRLTDRLKLMLNTFGSYLLAQAAITLSMLLFDATPVQAAGYGSLVWAGSFLFNILTGNYRKVGVDEGKHWIWFVLMATVSATTLL